VEEAEDASCLIYALQEPAAEAHRPNIDSQRLEVVGSSAPADALESGNGRYPILSGSGRVPKIANPAQVVRLRATFGPSEVLVIGTYRTDEPNTMEHITHALRQAVRARVTQRWVALGTGLISRDLRTVTAHTEVEKRPKFEALQKLLAREHLDSYDFVVVMSDNVLLPTEFLDSFLAVQLHADFALAQPARAAGSTVGLPIVEQQLGALARRTLVVQPRPIVSFHRSIYGLVFPFDMTSPSGLGYESIWALDLDQQGHRMGIVDAVPVELSSRDTSPVLDWDRSDMGKTLLLRTRPHLPLAACTRVVELIPLEAEQAMAASS
jgi:hypothetical protein